MKVPIALAVMGSSRQGSSNRLIVDYIRSRYADVARIEMYDQVDSLPPFNPDTNPEDAPVNVREWIEKIRQSDAVLVGTPEYVFSLPGMLKNALEWTVATTVFPGKPVAFIVASAWGNMP